MILNALYLHLKKNRFPSLICPDIIHSVDGSIWKTISHPPKSLKATTSIQKSLGFLLLSRLLTWRHTRRVPPDISCSKLLSWTNCLVLCSSDVGECRLWVNLLLEKILHWRIIRSLDDFGYKGSGGLLVSYSKQSQWWGQTASLKALFSEAWKISKNGGCTVTLVAEQHPQLLGWPTLILQMSSQSTNYYCDKHIKNHSEN